MTPPLDLDAFVEDVEWLIQAGEHPANICRRLGANASAIENRLRRNGRHDLSAYFYNERLYQRTDR